MKNIIVIEGPDGVGKSTLGLEITKQTKSSYIHCTYNKDWDMKDYHKTIIRAAYDLSEYSPVIIDRWAPSEYVYGKVFRGGESYDTKELIDRWKNDIVFIYCRNDNAVDNHLKNKETREEMFESINKVVKEFDKYIIKTPELDWIIYDFDEVNINKFVEDLLK